MQMTNKELEKNAKTRTIHRRNAKEFKYINTSHSLSTHKPPVIDPKLIFALTHEPNTYSFSQSL